eukprot:jgi/Mesen1/8893/ME000535S08205
MALNRTGVYLEDFMGYTKSLPHELQRLLSTMRELDDRAQNLQHQIREQCRACLSMPPQHSKKTPPEQAEAAGLARKEIRANQEKSVALCTEKVLLAQQAHDLVDSHVKRLTEDIAQFEQDLKQEGKIPPEEHLPERRRSSFLTPSPMKRGGAGGAGSESYGDMIACDNNKHCKGGEWFHYSCVGLTSEPQGKWFCPACRALQRRSTMEDHN